MSEEEGMRFKLGSYMDGGKIIHYREDYEEGSL
jgi:hypothetical protein